MKDFSYFFKQYFKATKIPLTLFDSEGNVLHASEQHFLVHMPDVDVKKLKNPDVFFTTTNAMFGYIRLDEGQLFIGPCFNVKMNEELFHSFLKEHLLDLKNISTASSLIYSTPVLHQFDMIQTLALLYYLFTQNVLDVNTHFDFINEFQSTKQHKDSAKHESSEKDFFINHNSYQIERVLYNYISTGQEEDLKAYLFSLQTLGNYSEGIMAKHPLRQQKNIFIGTVTKMGMLGAIPGGLDVEETYRLIDYYSLECEKKTSFDDILQLHYNAAMDFCTRVKAKKIPEGIPRDIAVAISFIRNHTNEKIELPDVANHIKKSVPYLTKAFKSKLGITVGAFIRRCKLEEAKNLLTYSDMTLSEISNYLCFSSQSYFQNCFKNQYHVTPNDYREQTK